MSDRPSPLSYDRPANAGIPRWQFRLLFLLVLLNLAITIQSSYAPGVVASVKARWQAYQLERQAKVHRQQAMTFTQPPGKVVWDEDPATAAALLASPDYRKIEIRGERDRSVRGRPLPAPVPAGARARLPDITRPVFSDLLPGYPHPIQPEETALVFLHARTSKAGEALVCVGARGDAAFGGRFDPGDSSHDTQWTAMLGRRLSIVAAACDFSVRPGSRLPARATPREDRIAELIIERDNQGPDQFGIFANQAYARATLRWTPPQANQPGKLALEATDSFRLYAGQPDPADPSHFTIAYDYAGRRGTIHGYLKDNGGVELKPDAGVVTGRSWKPPGAAQTAPASGN